MRPSTDVVSIHVGTGTAFLSHASHSAVAYTAYAPSPSSTPLPAIFFMSIAFLSSAANHGASTSTSWAFTAIPVAYLAIAAAFPAARADIVGVHALRGLVLAAAAALQMASVRQFVRCA